MPATFSNTENYTASREIYNATIRHADRIPALGLIKSYRSTEYDDFGNTEVVFIRSTERPNENGDITWTETKVIK